MTRKNMVILLLLPVLALFQGCYLFQPMANFTLEEASGEAPLEVSFVNHSRTGPGALLRYEWDFGDGTPVSEEEAPTHLYETPGIYSVKLTIVTSFGRDTMVRYGAVRVNQPGIVVKTDFSVEPSIGYPPLNASFTDLTEVENTNIKDWYWQFGDGTSSTEQNPQHTYHLPGSYTVTLTVNTDAGKFRSVKPNSVVVEETGTLITAQRAIIPEAPVEPGEQVLVNVVIICSEPGNLTALGLREILPAGWTFVDVIASGDIPDQTDSDSEQNTVSFAWLDIPDFPMQFTYRIQAPDTCEGSAFLAGALIFRFTGPSFEASLDKTELQCVGIQEGEPVEGEGEPVEGEGEPVEGEGEPVEGEGEPVEGEGEPVEGEGEPVEGEGEPVEGEGEPVEGEGEPVEGEGEPVEGEGEPVEGEGEPVEGEGEPVEGETKDLRPILGDHEHISSTALRIYSSLYLSPIFSHEFYRLGKIIGYSSIAGLVKTFNILPILEAVKKTNNSHLFKHAKILELQEKGWKYAGGAKIEDVEVGCDLKSLRYTLDESSCGVIRSAGERFSYEPLLNSCNCIEVGVLSGQAEALLGGVWEGFETCCMGKGDSRCRIVLNSRNPDVNHRTIEPVSKIEYSRILEKSIDLALSPEKNTGRKEVSDGVLISLSQAINYLMLSASKGHIVLSKWAGKKVGRDIVRKSGERNLFSSLDFLKSFFFDLRIGLMDYETGCECIRIKVDESVYSSGVENINMKLCIFLAGMIEGGLCEATRSGDLLDDESEWIVTETKCTAKGDPFCEFECRHRDPDLLKRMLLG